MGRGFAKGVASSWVEIPTKIICEDCDRARATDKTPPSAMTVGCSFLLEFPGHWNWMSKVWMNKFKEGL